MGLLLGLGMLGMILDGRTAMQGAAEGVELCLMAVIPALLPFLCLSMALTDRLWGRENRILKGVGQLLRLPVGGEGLLIPALLGGYPAGAACIGRAFRQGQLAKEDAEILLGFCSLPGPAFLFGIVSQAFPSTWAVWALWLLVLLGAWTASRILPGCRGTATVSDSGRADVLGQAGAAMGRICVLVILFRVGLRFLNKYLRLSGNGAVLAVGVLELTNGCCALASVEPEALRFLFAAGMLSMGGVCVALQTAQVASGLSLRYYCLGKAIQTVTAVFFGWILVSHQWFLGVAALAALIFLTKRKKKVAFFEKRVYTIPKDESGRKLCFSVRK